MKCALVIGHSEISPGAVNQRWGTTEFSFNERLALDVELQIPKLVEVVYRTTYSRLPREINALHPDFVMELHCNAFNQRVSGTETLYWHTSERGRRLASILQSRVGGALRLTDRGIKPRKRGQRGAYLLRRTHAPAVIAEPFFIDNDRDLAMARAYYLDLVDAMVGTVTEVVESGL